MSSVANVVVFPVRFAAGIAHMPSGCASRVSVAMFAIAPLSRLTYRQPHTL